MFVCVNIGMDFESADENLKRNVTPRYFEFDEKTNESWRTIGNI